MRISHPYSQHSQPCLFFAANALEVARARWHGAGAVYTGEKAGGNPGDRLTRLHPSAVPASVMTVSESALGSRHLDDGAPRLTSRIRAEGWARATGFQPQMVIGMAGGVSRQACKFPNPDRFADYKSGPHAPFWYFPLPEDLRSGENPDEPFPHFVEVSIV